MTHDFASRDDLESRLSSLSPDTDRIALLVGAGMSWGCVPGVEGIIEVIRQQFPLERDQEALDQKLAQGDPSARYQTATDFVIKRRNLDVLNTIIRDAVLRAVKEGTNTHNLERLEHEHAQWNLNKGLLSLGELLAKHPARFGPVLTTNFDPLVEVATSKAKGQAITVNLPADGAHNIVAHPQRTDVVHLHGFWRGERDTLHTPEQLARERPRLQAWLEGLLRTHSLFVFGYSGWPDVFTRTLLKALGNETVKQVCWCLYSPADKISHEMHEKVIKPFSGTGRVTFYAGIDAHDLLPWWEQQWSPEGTDDHLKEDPTQNPQ